MEQDAGAVSIVVSRISARRRPLARSGLGPLVVSGDRPTTYLARQGRNVLCRGRDTRVRRRPPKYRFSRAYANRVIESALAQGYWPVHEWLDILFHRVVRRLRDTRAAVSSSALITPLLLMLTFSIIDLASMFRYLALENGVSQATRYGVTGNLMDDPLNPGTALNQAESMKLWRPLRCLTIGHRLHV